jgi:hypothetical protein
MYRIVFQSALCHGIISLGWKRAMKLREAGELFTLCGFMRKINEASSVSEIIRR